jgi:hypothetical protein
LILVTVISSIAGLIGIELLNHNWFRREHFKVETNFEKKSNDLKLKKLARELGVSSQKAPPEPPERGTGANLLTAILPELIKNIEPDTLANIATNLIGNYGGAGVEDEGGGGGIGNLIGDFIEDNPKIIAGFLEGVKGGKKTDNFATQV